jgi:hypothetical protein
MSGRELELRTWKKCLEFNKETNYSLENGQKIQTDSLIIREEQLKPTERCHQADQNLSS